MVENTTESNNSVEVSLFGGAISATLPKNFRDISDFVPVPDN